MPRFAKAVRLAAVVALVTTVSSCGSTTDPTFTVPDLPQIGSWTADLTYFIDGPAGAGTHFEAARQIVATANPVTVQLAELARTVYSGAEDAQRTQQGNSYHWAYVSTGDLAIDADLSARSGGPRKATWEMHITSGETNPALTDFLWITGESELNNLSGQWRVFDIAVPTTRTPVLDVAWTNIGTNSWRVVFKNLRAGTATENDYIDFESALDLHRITYRDAPSDARTIIDWNSVTGIGQIVSPGYNGGQRSCWNATLANATCPN